MATTRRTKTPRPVEYPTSDGKPMAETDVHRQDMVDLIATLQDHFAADPLVYISGNILLFYEEGNRRKHIAPDVLMVRGVPKLPPRKFNRRRAKGDRNEAPRRDASAWVRQYESAPTTSPPAMVAIP